MRWYITTAITAAIVTAITIFIFNWYIGIGVSRKKQNLIAAAVDAIAIIIGGIVFCLMVYLYTIG